MEHKKLTRLKKQLPTGWAEEADAMGAASLRDVVIEAETALVETDKSQESDMKLQGALEIAKDLKGAYTDARKAQRAKIAYALYLLAEKGVL